MIVSDLCTVWILAKNRTSVQEVAEFVSILRFGSSFPFNQIWLDVQNDTAYLNVSNASLGGHSDGVGFAVSACACVGGHRLSALRDVSEVFASRTPDGLLM